VNAYFNQKEKLRFYFIYKIDQKFEVWTFEAINPHIDPFNFYKQILTEAEKLENELAKKHYPDFVEVNEVPENLKREFKYLNHIDLKIELSI